LGTEHLIDTVFSPNDSQEVALSIYTRNDLISVAIEKEKEISRSLLTSPRIFDITQRFPTIWHLQENCFLRFSQNYLRWRRVFSALLGSLIALSSSHPSHLKFLAAQSRAQVLTVEKTFRRKHTIRILPAKSCSSEDPHSGELIRRLQGGGDNPEHRYSIKIVDFPPHRTTISTRNLPFFAPIFPISFVYFCPRLEWRPKKKRQYPEKRFTKTNSTGEPIYYLNRRQSEIAFAFLCLAMGV